MFITFDLFFWLVIYKMSSFQMNYRDYINVFWKKTIKTWALDQFFIGSDFSAKKSVSASYESVSYVWSSAVLQV